MKARKSKKIELKILGKVHNQNDFFIKQKQGCGGVFLSPTTIKNQSDMLSYFSIASVGALIEVQTITLEASEVLTFLTMRFILRSARNSSFISNSANCHDNCGVLWIMLNF